MRITSVLWMVAAGLAGCADSTTDTTPPATTRETLAIRQTFDVDLAARIPLHVTMNRDATVALPTQVRPLDLDVALDLVVEDGQIATILDEQGNLRIEGMAYDLADLSMAPFGRPDVTITGAQLALRGPVTCATSWSQDDDYGFCDSVTAPIALGGQLRIAGNTLPIAIELRADLVQSMMVAPYEGYAMWLWINGSVASDFVWNGYQVAVDVDTHVDAYNGLIE